MMDSLYDDEMRGRSDGVHVWMTLLVIACFVVFWMVHVPAVRATDARNAIGAAAPIGKTTWTLVIQTEMGYAGRFAISGVTVPGFTTADACTSSANYALEHRANIAYCLAVH